MEQIFYQKMKYYTFFVIVLLFMSPALKAQEAEIPTGSAVLYDINYGISWSAGDLNKRFGRKNVLGAGVTFQNTSNFQIGLGLNYFFGTQVKEDVLSNLRNAQGNIIGTDGFPAIVLLRERGINLNINIGKVFNLEPDSKSGIKVNFGMGLLQHWIRVQDETNSVPQIVGDYRFGYDRKTRGIAFTQFIGYQLLSADSRVNFYGGLEFHEALSTNIRPFNFASQVEETDSRKDLNIGLKVGFIVPFYKADKPDEIFY